MLKLANVQTKKFAELKAMEACPQEGICWLEAEKPSDVELETIRQLTGVPESLLRIAIDEQTSVQANAENGWLLLVTRALDTSQDSTRQQHLGLLVSEKQLISIHETTLPEIEDACDDWRTEPTKGGPDLLYYLLDAVLDRLFPMLDDIEDRLYEIEEGIIRNEVQQPVLHGILRTSRELLVIRKVGSAIRESANAILRRTAQQEAQWSHFQEVYDHSTRVVDIAEMLHEVSSSCIDANLATVSNQLNSVMKTLTIMATILMTVSLISGIFGMNFAFPAMVKEQSLGGFWIATGAMGASVMGLLAWFRKMRYLG